MADEIKGQGALAGIELGHGGARGEGAKFSPSSARPSVRIRIAAVWCPRRWSSTTSAGCTRLGRRGRTVAADLGFDIVYAYGGHGMIPAQFLSPYFNRRPDSYGGSLENRGRFLFEIMEGIRDAVGDRCIVAARIAAETFSSHGGVDGGHAGVHLDGRRVHRPVGRQRRSHVGAGLGALARSGRGLPGGVDAAGCAR